MGRRPLNPSEFSCSGLFPTGSVTTPTPKVLPSPGHTRVSPIPRHSSPLQIRCNHSTFCTTRGTTHFRGFHLFKPASSSAPATVTTTATQIQSCFNSEQFRQQTDSALTRPSISLHHLRSMQTIFHALPHGVLLAALSCIASHTTHGNSDTPQLNQNKNQRLAHILSF